MTMRTQCKWYNLAANFYKEYNPAYNVNSCFKIGTRRKFEHSLNTALSFFISNKLFSFSQQLLYNMKPDKCQASNF